MNLHIYSGVIALIALYDAISAFLFISSVTIHLRLQQDCMNQTLELNEWMGVSDIWLQDPCNLLLYGHDVVCGHLTWTLGLHIWSLESWTNMAAGSRQQFYILFDLWEKIFLFWFIYQQILLFVVLLTKSLTIKEKCQSYEPGLPIEAETYMDIDVRQHFLKRKYIFFLCNFLGILLFLTLMTLSKHILLNGNTYILSLKWFCFIVGLLMT